MTIRQGQERDIPEAKRSRSRDRTVGNVRVEPPTDEDSNAWVDPVCGMNVAKLSAIFAADYEGRTYRFCSPECRSKFEAEPSAFALSSPESASS